MKKLSPHLNAAFNLARRLMRNEHDAEDVVQESYLGALRSFQRFQLGPDGHAWLLKIVRNTCCTGTARTDGTKFEEGDPDAPIASSNPIAPLVAKMNSELVHKALEDSSIEQFELLIRRELKGKVTYCRA